MKLIIVNASRVREEFAALRRDFQPRGVFKAIKPHLVNCRDVVGHGQIFSDGSDAGPADDLSMVLVGLGHAFDHMRVFAPEVENIVRMIQDDAERRATGTTVIVHQEPVVRLLLERFRPCVLTGKTASNMNGPLPAAVVIEHSLGVIE